AKPSERPTSRCQGMAWFTRVGPYLENYKRGTRINTGHFERPAKAVFHRNGQLRSSHPYVTKLSGISSSSRRVADQRGAGPREVACGEWRVGRGSPGLCPGVALYSPHSTLHIPGGINEA